MIKIVRLKDNGFDIICDMLDQTAESVTLDQPMEFEVRNKELAMNYWLPINMIKENSVSIKLDNILCVIDPTSEFVEFYANTVERIGGVLSGDEDQEHYEDIMDAMDELDSNKGLVIH